jgi:hypothetical protein
MPPKLNWIELKSFDTAEMGINFLSSKVPKTIIKSSDELICKFDIDTARHKLKAERRKCTYCKQCPVEYRLIKCTICDKSQVYYLPNLKHTDPNVSSPAASLLLEDAIVLPQAGYNDGLHPKIKEYIDELYTKNIHAITPKQVHIHLHEPKQETLMKGLPMPGIDQIGWYLRGIKKES